MSEEINILFPDETVTVKTADGEETVTVREFRFGESARAIPIARPILGALAKLGEEASIESFEDLLAEHWDACVQLIAISTGRDRDWIEALPDESGQMLALRFWQVNAGFFLRRLAAQAEMMRQQP